MRKTIFLLLVCLVLLNVIVDNTSAYFSDTETSSGNVLTAWVDPAITLLNDGFEGEPWDVNWDDNGTTVWVSGSSKPHDGSYYAEITNKGTPGYLTSDDMDSATADYINVSFWFKTKSVETGDIVIQLYNGTTYDTWYDLTDYPTYVNNTWCQFNEVITDPQYLISGFRLRFDATALGDSTEAANIDDVLVTME